MNAYVKTFFLRGAIFAGFGPIVAGIILLILQHTLPDFSLSGTMVFIATLSTYVLAFLHAGASVFYMVEHWPFARSFGFHFLTLYLAYSLCYCINAWIPFEPIALLIFTAVFVLIYFAVLLTVYLCIRRASKRFNRHIRQ